MSSNSGSNGTVRGVETQKGSTEVLGSSFSFVVIDEMVGGSAAAISRGAMLGGKQ